MSISTVLAWNRTRNRKPMFQLWVYGKTPGGYPAKWMPEGDPDDDVAHLNHIADRYRALGYRVKLRAWREIRRSS